MPEGSDGREVMTMIMWRDGAHFEELWNHRMGAPFPKGFDASDLAMHSGALFMSGLEMTNATSLVTATDNSSSEQDLAAA